MVYTIKIPTLDVRCKDAWPPGDHVGMPPDLLSREGGLESLRRFHPNVPQDIQIDTNFYRIRYRSESRTAHGLRTSFNDNFALFICDSIWTSGLYHTGIWCEGTYAISLRLSGNTVEIFDNYSYPFQESSCYMPHYAPGRRCFLELTPEEPFTEITVCFREPLLKEKFNLDDAQVQHLLSPKSDQLSLLSFNQCRMTLAIESICRELLSACKAGILCRLSAEAKALELISLYFKQLQAQAEPPNHAMLSRRDIGNLLDAKQYLNKNYATITHINELSRAIGMSRTKLMKSFKTEFGQTIGEYIHDLRIEKAKQLLQDQYANISEIAVLVGYSHQSNFTTAFKRQTGLSPKQFSAKYEKVPS